MRYTDVWTRLDRTLTTAEPNWRPEPFRLVCSPSDAWITPLHRAALDLSSLDQSRLKNDPVALQEWLADCDASLLDLAEIVQSMPSCDVRTSPPTRRTQPRAVCTCMSAQTQSSHDAKHATQSLASDLAVGRRTMCLDENGRRSRRLRSSLSKEQPPLMPAMLRRPSWTGAQAKAISPAGCIPAAAARVRTA